MAVSSNHEWTQKVAAFHANPSHFLASTTAENFVHDLLRVLTDEKMGENIKVPDSSFLKLLNQIHIDDQYIVLTNAFLLVLKCYHYRLTDIPPK